MSLNSVALMGRLANEPDLRTTGSGTSVATFTLAVDRDFGDNKETDFVSCVAWAKTGEHVAKWFHKGQMMALHGSLQSRKWEDRDGNKRTNWEVVANSTYFCGDKKSGQSGAVNVSGANFEELSEDSGELPF